MATPSQSDVYYQGVYWNDYEVVRRYMCRRAFGVDADNWLLQLGSHLDLPFERALSLNCGTGWVERELITQGVVRSAVGVDFFDDLLERARGESAGLPIEYVQMDTNSAAFPHGPYDLVLNHAAGHHITRVDAVFRKLHSLLPPHGRLLVWDYTGPHRNQYGSRMWAAATAVNDSLPLEYRSPMLYPHLPTMLEMDPTEAVHSELLLEVMHRYFEWVELRSLGGPIAYLVLTHNESLRSAPEATRDELIERVLDADASHVAAYPEDNLFTYAVGRPRPCASLSAVDLERWERQENDREECAEANGGRYYAPSVVQLREYAREFGPGGILLPREPRTLRFAARAVARKVPGAVPVLRRLRRFVRRAPRKG